MASRWSSPPERFWTSWSMMSSTLSGRITSATNCGCTYLQCRIVWHFITGYSDNKLQCTTMTMTDLSVPKCNPLFLKNDKWTRITLLTVNPTVTVIDVDCVWHRLKYSTRLNVWLRGCRLRDHASLPRMRVHTTWYNAFSSVLYISVLYVYISGRRWQNEHLNACKRLFWKKIRPY